MRPTPLLIAVLLLTSQGALTQSVPRATAGRQATGEESTIYRNGAGHTISAAEFADIRMANPGAPDATTTRTLENGAIELRASKIRQEGTRAPDFAFTTLDGKTISSGMLKGKVVVLNFWFIGCPICNSHKPFLNSLREAFAEEENVVFVAATADAGRDVNRYLQEHPLDYIQTANAGAVLKKFAFSGYPKNIVISKTGKIVYWRTSVTAWESFEAVIRTEAQK